MDSKAPKTVTFTDVKVEDDTASLDIPIIPIKKAAHPFLCRLKETAHFTITTPSALIAAGFASMGMGLFTLFRPTPVLLFLLAYHYERETFLPIGKTFFMYATIFWQGSIIFILVVLGFILTFSVKIKKRSVLLLHPWGLLILYFDAFAWLALTLCFHLELPQEKNAFTIDAPLVYFIIIYVENLLFFFIHYVYATYFITAELSVIERCY